MKKLLVAIDGSDNSIKALHKTAELTDIMEAETTILYVIDNTINNPYISLNEYKQSIDEAFKEQGEEILRESLKIFEKKDIKANTVIEYGDPGKIIVEFAEEGNYDLIVMGSRGLNALSRVMLGSVSNKVLNHSKVSVLIVKNH